jgi:peptide/nickel transport system ATP-binding protein/oligopeptide transport system ATP-binding protein
MSGAALLEVRGVSKRFVAKRNLLGRAVSHVNAVDGVSFSLEAGQTLALVGESGCGKSTVGRLVLGLIEPTGGDVRISGRSLGQMSGHELRAMRAAAQLIFQDPYASLNPRMTIGETLDEPLMLHTTLSRTERLVRVGELLEMVGLDGQYARRYPHEFSGGQRQRIAIARALAVSPKLVVCDEPVSALDVSIRAQVLNLLRDLQRRLGLALVFISHDLSVVKHVADRVAVMYLGRIVEQAPTTALFAVPRHPYTQALLSAIPVPSPTARRERRLLSGDPPSPIDPPPGCHLHTRCPHADEVCRSAVPALDPPGGAHQAACHRLGAIGAGGFRVPVDGTIPPHLRKLLDAYRDVA